MLGLMFEGLFLSLLKSGIFRGLYVNWLVLQGVNIPLDG